jgi:hypothetical protein
MSNRAKLIVVASACIASFSGRDACAQQTPAQAYDQRYNRTTYSRPYTYDNLSRAIVDTQFYHRPSVSPYLNLFRPTDGGAASNYYNFVQPEQYRRDRVAAEQLNRQLQPLTPGGGNLSTATSAAGNAPVIRPPRQGITNSAHYKQFYGLQ